MATADHVKALIRSHAEGDEERFYAIAMQVAAMNPAGLRPEDVPADAIGGQEANALLSQAFIKDPSRNIEQLIHDVIATTGENVKVARFTRFELGQS